MHISGDIFWVGEQMEVESHVLKFGNFAFGQATDN